MLHVMYVKKCELVVFLLFFVLASPTAQLIKKIARTVHMSVRDIEIAIHLSRDDRFRLDKQMEPIAKTLSSQSKCK